MVDEFSRELTRGKPRTKARLGCVYCHEILSLSDLSTCLSYKKPGSQNALREDRGSAIICVAWVGDSALKCAAKRNRLIRYSLEAFKNNNVFQCAD